MTIALDPELHDSVLAFEIELLGEVLAAAASATAHLTQGQIDAALGVGGPPGRSSHGTAPPPPRL